jgi:ribosomal protein L19E
MTTQRVGDLLLLAGSKKEIRDLVAEGTVSASQAIETVKKHGDKAAEKLEAGAAKAKAQGKRKATRKHIDSKPTCRAVVKALVEWNERGGSDKELTAICKMALEAVA